MICPSWVLQQSFQTGRALCSAFRRPETAWQNCSLWGWEVHGHTTCKPQSEGEDACPPDASLLDDPMVQCAPQLSW